MQSEKPSAGSRMTKVNTRNEWDPLGHVLVGRPNGGMIPAPEPAMELEVSDAQISPTKWGCPFPTSAKVLRNTWIFSPTCLRSVISAGIAQRHWISAGVPNFQTRSSLQ